MFKLSYNYMDFNEGGYATEIYEFKTKGKALAYAKKKYFNHKDTWYVEMLDIGITEDYGVKTLKEVCNIDFDEFKKHNKFKFTDGRYVYGTLKLNKLKSHKQ